MQPHDGAAPEESMDRIGRQLDDAEAAIRQQIKIREEYDQKTADLESRISVIEKVFCRYVKMVEAEETDNGALRVKAYQEWRAAGDRYLEVLMRGDGGAEALGKALVQASETYIDKQLELIGQLEQRLGPLEAN